MRSLAGIAPSITHTRIEKIRHQTIRVFARVFHLDDTGALEIGDTL
jgi:hypothetical protein